MEIDLLSKIYVLYHLHKVMEDNIRSYYDGKEIGQFFSIEEAKEVLEKYKKVKGFKDYPEGFHIDEYQIDSLYNQKINSLLDTDIRLTNRLKTVYFLYYYKEYDENECEDASILGIFSSRKLAQKAREKLIKDHPKVFTNYLVIYDRDIGTLSWVDGFFTI